MWERPGIRERSSSLPTCPPGTGRFPSSRAPSVAAGLSLLGGKVAGPLALIWHGLGSPGGPELRGRTASSSFQSQSPRNCVMGILLPDNWSEWCGWPPSVLTCQGEAEGQGVLRKARRPPRAPPSVAGWGTQAASSHSSRACCGLSEAVGGWPLQKALRDLVIEPCHLQVSSFASEELRSFRDAEQSSEPPGLRDLGLQPLPAPPPPPPATQAASTSRTVARSSSGSPAQARQALMDAIRSGTGAARLRKVTVRDHVSVRVGPAGGQQGATRQGDGRGEEWLTARVPYPRDQRRWPSAGGGRPTDQLLGTQGVPPHV